MNLDIPITDMFLCSLNIVNSSKHTFYSLIYNSTQLTYCFYHLATTGITSTTTIPLSQVCHPNHIPRNGC